MNRRTFFKLAGASTSYSVLVNVNGWGRETGAARLMEKPAAKQLAGGTRRLSLFFFVFGNGQGRGRGTRRGPANGEAGCQDARSRRAPPVRGNALRRRAAHAVDGPVVRHFHRGRRHGGGVCGGGGGAARREGDLGPGPFATGRQVVQ